MRSLAFVSLLLGGLPVRADRMADYTLEVRAAIADVCVIGTVTEIEKELVPIKAYPGATQPTLFSVAVVKVETNIQGAKNITHVRVGFQSPAPGVVPRYPQPVLKVDQNVCLFLNKVPDTVVLLMPGLSPPLLGNDTNKEAVELLKKMATVFADPLAALKAEKPEDRSFAAVTLVTKYRHSRLGVATTSEAIPVEESRAILAALAEGDWTANGRRSAATAVQLLALSKAEGFQVPTPKPGEDLLALTQAEFKRWLGQEGAKYNLKKLVPNGK